MLTVVVDLALGLRIGATAALPAYLFFGASGAVLAVHDIYTSRVPNWMLIPSYFGELVLLIVAAGIDGHWEALVRAIGAMAVLFLSFALVALGVRHGLGFGDVKLAGLVGLVTGYLDWETAALGIVLAFVGALVPAFALLLRNKGRTAQFPFAPLLVIGTVLAICIRH